MYVDGFILAVPSRKLPAYRRLSLKAAKVWKELARWNIESVSPTI